MRHLAGDEATVGDDFMHLGNQLHRGWDKGSCYLLTSHSDGNTSFIYIPVYDIKLELKTFRMKMRKDVGIA